MTNCERVSAKVVWFFGASSYGMISANGTLLNNLNETFVQANGTQELKQNASRVDYIGYVSTPLFFFVGIVGT